MNSNHKNSDTPHANIQECYELGREVLAEMEVAPGKHKFGVVANFMKKVNCKEGMIRRAIQLARTFTDAELHAFTALRAADTGEPLSLAHAFAIMYLPDRRKRMQLARAAAENGWTADRLALERKVKFGVDKRASKGGRRTRLPATPEAALAHLAVRADRFIRAGREIHAAQDGNGAESVVVATIPPVVRRRLDAALEAVSTLINAINEAQAAVD